MGGFGRNYLIYLAQPSGRKGLGLCLAGGRMYWINLRYKKLWEVAGENKHITLQLSKRYHTVSKKTQMQ